MDIQDKEMGSEKRDVIGATYKTAWPHILQESHQNRTRLSSTIFLWGGSF